MRVQTALKNKGGHTKFVRICFIFLIYCMFPCIYLHISFHSFLQNIKKWEVDQDFCALHYAPKVPVCSILRFGPLRPDFSILLSCQTGWIQLPLLYVIYKYRAGSLASCALMWWTNVSYKNIWWIKDLIGRKLLANSTDPCSAFSFFFY